MWNNLKLKGTLKCLGKKHKEIGKKKQIRNLIRPLGKYTFECAVIFLNSFFKKQCSVWY